MRNYVTMKAMHWTSNNGANLWAFGSDDENLLENVLRMEAFVGDPPYSRTTPRIIYFLLDEVNFATILSATLDIAYQIWIRTRLNNGQFPLNDFADSLLYDVTRVKDVEGSPRQSWSHGK